MYANNYTNIPIALFISILNEICVFTRFIHTRYLCDLTRTCRNYVTKDGNRIYSYPHSQQEFVTRIQNPVLVSDDYKFYHIQNYIDREIVQLLLRKPTTIIEYDGLTMEFEQGKYHSVRSPSIDTLLFCRAIMNLDYSDIETVLEA